MRARTLACLAVIVIALGASCRANAEPLRPTEDSWPVFRGDSGLTGVSPVRLPGELFLRWTFKTAAPIRSSPVIGGGRVFFGSSDGSVYALSLATGEKLWERAAGSPVEAPPLLDGPALYVGTLDGTFLRLDAASGKQRWKLATKAKIAGSANLLRRGSGPAIVLVGSYDGSLYAANAGNGRLLWTYHTNNYINGAPALIGNLAVFGGCDALLHVVSVLDGSQAAEIDTGSYIPGSAAAAHGRVYVGNFDDRLICADLAGSSILWEYRNDRRGGGFFSSPAVGEDAVVIGGRDYRVHCVGVSDGKLRWTFEAGGEVDSSPVIAGDAVLFGTGDGRLVMLTLRSGRLLWSYEIGEPVASSPAVASGMVVVGCDDGSLYAFGG